MNKLLIIGLIAIVGLTKSVIQLTRKYLVSKMDIYSIIAIDLFITGFFYSAQHYILVILQKLKKTLLIWIYKH